MSTSDLYTGDTYVDNNPTYHVEDSAWKAREIGKILRANSLSPSSIVEVGCGAGEILALLHKQLDGPPECTGFEVSPAAHALCEQRAAPGLRYVLGDPFAGTERFALAMAIDVIEHVEDPYSFARGMGRIADYSVFHIPLALNVLSVIRMGEIMNARRKVGHIQVFSRELALATLEDSGHSVVDWHYTRSPIKRLRAALATLPRRILYAIHPDFAVRLLGGHSLMVLTRPRG